MRREMEKMLFSLPPGHARIGGRLRRWTGLLLVACLCLWSRASAQQIGELFDIQAQNASYDQSNSVSVFNPDDNEIAVVYVREAIVTDASDPFTARRDEVRATIYNSSDMSVLANNILILQQSVPNDRVGCRPDNRQFDNLDLSYNAFTGEYVVAAGAQTDPDNGCPNPQDIGQVWVQRFATGTGAPAGTTYILTNGPAANSVEESVNGAEVALACSTVNGNILMVYGRGVHAVGDTVVAGILLSPTLVPLNTGPGIMGQDLSSATGPFFFPLHFFQSNNISFDETRREFLVPWFNQYTTNGVAFSSADIHLRTVSDTLSATNTLALGPNNTLLQSDLNSLPTMSFGGGQNQTILRKGFSKPIRNPFLASANTEFVIAYNWDKLGVTPNPNDPDSIDSEYPYDGLRLYFFGLDAGGATLSGPTVDVLSVAESSTQVHFPKLVSIPEQNGFGIIWIDDLVSQQGYANNAAWQNAPPELPGGSTSFRDIRYLLTDSAGVRIPGFGTGGGILRTGADDLIDGKGDTPYAIYVPPANAVEGYLLASWEERSSTGEKRHPVAMRVSSTAPPVPLAVRNWEVYK